MFVEEMGRSGVLTKLMYAVMYAPGLCYLIKLIGFRLKKPTSLVRPTDKASLMVLMVRLPNVRF